MSALGQTRKSEATPGRSAPGGNADEIRAKADIAPQRSAIWRDARRNFTSARSQIVTFKRGATAAHVDRLMEKLGFALWVKLET